MTAPSEQKPPAESGAPQSRRLVISMLLKGLFLVLLLVLAAAVAGIAWLGGTSDGARTAFRVLSAVTPLQIESRRIEGKILGDLTLEGVHASLPKRKIDVAHLRLSWLPHGLLNGKLLVRELELKGVKILDSSPLRPKEVDYPWPRVSGPLARMEARIQRLLLENAEYRHVGSKPVSVTALTASASLSGGVLSLEGVSLAMPGLGASGRVNVGLLSPFLSTDLTIGLPGNKRPVDRIGVIARLGTGKEGEQVQGPVSVILSSGGKKVASVVGGIGLTRNGANLKSLVLKQTGRSGSVTLSGNIHLTATEPVSDLVIGFTGVDLKPEGLETLLSGHAVVKGSPSRYRGDFRIANRGSGWRSASVSARFSGSADGVTLFDLSGSVLGGHIGGNLQARWGKGVEVKGALQGRGLDPSILDQRYRGNVNIALSGSVFRSASGVVAGGVEAGLQDSTFQGFPLTGEASVRLADGETTIRRMLLRGTGFQLAAEGNPARKVRFSLDVARIDSLFPEARGMAAVRGEVHWQGGIPSGTLHAEGRGLQYKKAGADSARISATIGAGPDPPVGIEAELQRPEHGQLTAGSALFRLSGTLSRHDLSASLVTDLAEARVGLHGGYREKKWQGELVTLDGHDEYGPWQLQRPAPLEIRRDKITLSGMEIAGSGGENLALDLRLDINAYAGEMNATWHNLLLARLNPWLSEARLAGSTSGRISTTLYSRSRFAAAGEVSAAGAVSLGERRIEFGNALMRAEWQDSGLSGMVDVKLPQGGRVAGLFSSSAPPRPELPRDGQGDLQWEGVDVAYLRPWLPASLQVGGTLSGRVTGKLLPGRTFDILGRAALTGGTIGSDGVDGRIATGIRTLEASWSWREDALQGGVTLELSRWGRGRGAFRLGAPAKLPLALNKDTPLVAHATAEAAELGLLAAVFPDMVQESHGELSFDIRADGTVAAPRLAGDVNLRKAGGYIPSAGIRLAEVQLHAGLEQDAVTIDRFRADSGIGYLDGSATVKLSQGHVAGYEGVIGGKSFQAVNLPEVVGVITPSIRFTGTAEGATVKGDILIPELRIKGETPQAPVQPSKDVIITDAPPEEKESRFALVLQLGITLGEHVTVEAKGIDARLGGGVQLAGDTRNLTSKGEIRVEKGRFKAYGLDLEIVRGRFFYAGGPVDQPTVDIRAVRTVEEVKAGVTVGGTIQSPVVKLYSEPPMPDVDILAYMVLGHPLGQSGEQTGILAKAAGALLSAGQSVALQDQLKSRLGLSTLEIETEGESSGYMGYTPVQSGLAPAGSTQTGAGEVAQTTLTVGKYLTPKLYISYGRSLFGGGNIFRLRYMFSRQFQLETQAGEQSGADLYYRIEFD